MRARRHDLERELAGANEHAGEAWERVSALADANDALRQEANRLEEQLRRVMAERDREMTERARLEDLIAEGGPALIAEQRSLREALEIDASEWTPEFAAIVEAWRGGGA
jgi:septal ring factor EnvC (AmiA/AmiB activator)